MRSLPLAEELDLEAHGLRYVDLDPMQVCLSWSADRPAVLFHDVERTLDALEVTHPDQVEGYRADLRAALPVARLVLDLAASPPTPARALGRPPGAASGASAAWPAGRGARWPRSCAATSAARRCSARPSPRGPRCGASHPICRARAWARCALALTHVVAPGRPVGGSGALTDAFAPPSRPPVGP